VPNGSAQQRHLATTERRSRAAVLVAQSAVATDDPVLVVDAIDLITGAILAVAGVAPDPARSILAVLWGRRDDD
jgi:hypothetical protein